MTNTRKRRCPGASASLAASELPNKPSNMVRWAAVLVLLLQSPALVQGFGITSPPSHKGSLAARGKTTSLSVSTLAPPPHHLTWLRSQEDQEKRLERENSFRRRQKSNKRPRPSTSSTTASEIPKASLPRTQVLPLTSFEAQDSLFFGNTNDTTNSAKEAWAASFTTVEALRDTFGYRTSFWGDLDAPTTRRLYKTLLPRALLELYHCHGASSEDLAPLAYRARVAAKKYARERSELPARVAASLFDGFRQYCKYGTFQVSGISYPQLWEKYATQIMQEQDFENEQDLTSKVCYKILEKSCETNKGVDAMFLTNQQQQEADLQEITRKLEQDVYALLNNDEGQMEDKNKWSIRRYKILRTLLRVRRQMEGLAYTEKDDDMAMQAILEDAAKE